MLDYPPDTVIYPSPAIDLGGYMLAYAIEGTDDPEASDDTHIVVFDLQTGSGRTAVPHRVWATGRPDYYDAKVGSLKVQPSGSVAWIACRTRQNIPEEWGNPRPSCVHAGAVDEVRVLRAGDRKAETLAVGRGIAPRSLRLRNGRIYWKRGTKMHSAPLP